MSFSGGSFYLSSNTQIGLTTWRQLYYSTTQSDTGVGNIPTNVVSRYWRIGFYGVTVGDDNVTLIFNNDAGANYTYRNTTNGVTAATVVGATAIEVIPNPAFAVSTNTYDINMYVKSTGSVFSGVINYTVNGLDITDNVVAVNSGCTTFGWKKTTTVINRVTFSSVGGISGRCLAVEIFGTGGI